MRSHIDICRHLGYFIEPQLKFWLQGAGARYYNSYLSGRKVQQTREINSVSTHHLLAPDINIEI